MCSACFASGFALTDFAVDVDAGLVDIAVLNNAGNVEHAVDPPVPTEVEAVSDWGAFALSGRQSDSTGAAPAGELRLATKPERITNLGEERGGSDPENVKGFGTSGFF